VNEWAIKLDALGHYYPHMSQFQPHFLWSQPGITPGPGNATQCNLYARDFVDSKFITDPSKDWAQGIGGLISDYSYDISPINPGKKIFDVILNTTIQTCHVNLVAAGKSGKVKLLTAEQAQGRANEGIPIHCVSGPMNHETIIISDPNNYNPDLGPMMSQSGSFVGCCYLGDKRSFGAYGKVKDILDKIIFVEYNELL